MTNSYRTKKNLVADHSWLLPEVDEIGQVTIYFPCHHLWGGDSSWVLDVHDVLTMIADDYDGSGRDGTVFRKIRDRLFAEDPECAEPDDMEGLEGFLDEIEAIEETQAPMRKSRPSHGGIPKLSDHTGGKIAVTCGIYGMQRRHDADAKFGCSQVARATFSARRVRSRFCRNVQRQMKTLLYVSSQRHANWPAKRLPLVVCRSEAGEKRRLRLLCQFELRRLPLTLS